MDNKKRFECPEATIVEFKDEDIIVTSGPGNGWGEPGDEYQD